MASPVSLLTRNAEINLTQLFRSGEPNGEGRYEYSSLWLLLCQGGGQSAFPGGSLGKWHDAQKPTCETHNPGCCLSHLSSVLQRLIGECHEPCSVSQNCMGSGDRLATHVSMSLSLHLLICKMGRGSIFYPVGSLWGSMQKIVFHSVKSFCVLYRNARDSCIFLDWINTFENQVLY